MDPSNLELIQPTTPTYCSNQDIEGDTSFKVEVSRPITSKTMRVITINPNNHTQTDYTSDAPTIYAVTSQNLPE